MGRINQEFISDAKRKVKEYIQEQHQAMTIGDTVGIPSEEQKKDENTARKKIKPTL